MSFTCYHHYAYSDIRFNSSPSAEMVVNARIVNMQAENSSICTYNSPRRSRHGTMTCPSISSSSRNLVVGTQPLSLPSTQPLHLFLQPRTSITSMSQAEDDRAAKAARAKAMMVRLCLQPPLECCTET
ncbi:hypothetical protein PAXRUDRAFT_185018 [Paxillus rubicundulus Ve08.2h10]|uniref:Uncharacterized protein n=1 Tax=Paxillus rubicundulus Ve08.2h10 TaxID=930991 RepID=A0A0D0EB79_9AGAM|nr:hypothetical protein PAXRUDRAFT_185018 [Paxillus rubicundulus Ve08.2h10]